MKTRRTIPESRNWQCAECGAWVAPGGRAWGIKNITREYLLCSRCRRLAEALRRDPIIKGGQGRSDMEVVPQSRDWGYLKFVGMLAAIVAVAVGLRLTFGG